jgi:hypothetical protein
MIDSISNAVQDQAQDTLGATIALAQGFPSLRCERSRRADEGDPDVAVRVHLHVVRRADALGERAQERAGVLVEPLDPVVPVVADEDRVGRLVELDAVCVEPGTPCAEMRRMPH